MNQSSLPALCFAFGACLLGAGSAARSFAQEPAPASPEAGEVVHLGEFTVSTTLGSYHEETSAMATKVPTSLHELPSSLQILNANAINDRSAVTLQDVYAYVTGVTQTLPNSNGFTFRGFSNSGTFTQNIETDGLQGGTLKKGAVSAANVESLEFLKGPNSVLYGQMHPGGLLNIVTKSPQETERVALRVTYSTYEGAFDTFGDKNGVTADVDLTGAIDAGKHLLYRLIVDAEDVPPSRPGDFDKSISIYPSLTYRWNARAEVTVKFEVSQDRRRQEEGLIPIFTQGIAYGANARYQTAPLNTVYQEPTDTGRDRGEAVSSNFRWALTDAWTVRAQTRTVWHVDRVQELTTNSATVFFPTSAFATPATTLKRQYNDLPNGHRYNFFDANVVGIIGPPRFLNTVVIGLGGGVEFFNNQRFAFGPNVTPAISLYKPILGQTPYPPDGTGALQSPRNTLTNFGEYLSDQLKIGERLHLSLGVRNDQQVAHGIDVFNPTKTPYAHQFVSSVTSQFGAVYDVSAPLALYVSWSQSVVPNSVTSVDASGNSGFAPEKGQQWETGLKWENATKNLFASFAAYYIDRTNVLATTGLILPVTGQGIFRLDGAQHSEGVEFETEWQPKPYWQIQVGAALGKAFIAASTKNPQTVGSDLAQAPRASGSFWNRFNIPTGVLRGFGAGVGVIYVGKQWAGDPTTTTYFTLPGWTRVDTAFFYKIHRYELALNIQNLFDRRYLAASQNAFVLYPGEQRKLTFSIATHF